MSKKSKSLYCYLTKDRLEYLKPSLEAYKRAGLASVDAIIVDGGSNDETRKFLEQYSDCFIDWEHSNRRELPEIDGITYNGTAYECAIRDAYEYAKRNSYEYFTIVESDSLPNEDEIFGFNEDLLAHLEKNHAGGVDVLSLYSTFFANSTQMSAEVDTDLGLYRVLKKRATFWGNCFITFKLEAYNTISVYARSTNDALDVTIGKPDVCDKYHVFIMMPSLVAHIGVTTAQNQDVPFHQGLQLYQKGLVEEYEDKVTYYPDYADQRLKDLFYVKR